MASLSRESRCPVCPDCGTDLTPIRQRHGKSALWCWKCERYLRLGEERTARKLAAAVDVDFGEPRPGSSNPMPPERRQEYEQRIRSAQPSGIRKAR